MKEYSPIQWTDLINSIGYILAPILIFHLLLGLLVYKTLVFNKLLLIISLILSIYFGYRFYMNKSHLKLSYDSKEFIFSKGKRITKKGRWRSYDKVSLVKKDYGELAVRVYRGKSYVEIPVSRLGLDAQEFRFEVMRFLK